MTAWLIGNMIWASLLLLVMLAFRTPFARLLGTGPVYALWLLDREFERLCESR